MPATLTQVVKQFRQDWIAQLEADAILKVCHDVGSAWRERCLDPVTTTQFLFVQVVHGNTAFVDGSRFSMPDTPELQEHCGRPGG